MAFELPALPYAKDALAPHISADTLEFHHGKHHAAYVNNLNNLVQADSSLAAKSLEDFIRTAKGPLFNNAAQVWNHTFYWNSLGPSGGGEPRGKVADALKASFGSFGDFKERFSKLAAGHFGSGWAWLVRKGGKLDIVDTHDAANPLTQDLQPVLTCDVWEHAYYIDYRNARPEYIKAFWNIVNWAFVEKNLS